MSGNISRSRCISASLSQSTPELPVAVVLLSVDIIIISAPESRGSGRAECACAGEGGARISRKRSSIAASDTALSASCWDVCGRLSKFSSVKS